MRVLVFGGAGMLGSEVVRLGRKLGHTVVAPPHTGADITKKGEVRRLASIVHPHLVINCAAYIDVKGCEDDPDKAYNVNALGSQNCAQVAGGYNAKYVYVSTGCVFGKESSDASVFQERSEPNPWCNYGCTKKIGEYLALNANPKTYIVRVSALFGPSECRGKGYNFPQLVYKKLKEEGRFTINSIGRISPTYAPDAAKAMWQAVETLPPAIFHFTNSGSCYWHDFAARTKELCGLDGYIDFNTELETERPRSVALLNTSPIKLRGWGDALKDYCKTLTNG